ncbi:MAG: TolC family protein, partial [Alistipes sp.]
SADGFDVQVPRMDSLTLESLHQLGDPNRVYDYADAHRPMIAAERTRLASSENALKIARAARYPTVALSAGYGTNLYRSYATGALNADFWSQFRNNGNEYIGASVRIPIFNRRATHNNIKSAHLAVRSQQLALNEAQQNLRKEIEQAYYNADGAFAKYRAADKALASARVAFGFEQEKMDAGRSTLFNYNDARTRMEKAESDLIQAKYEFVFRSKILDFYNGKPLQI